jgi:anti-anti-sigma factor
MASSADGKRQAIVELQGRQAGDAAASRLSAQVRDLLNQGYEYVLLNVGQLTYIDSVLLGAVVQAHVAAIRSGARVGILNATKRFRELLATTRLNRIIEIVEAKQDGGPDAQ